MNIKIIEILITSGTTILTIIGSIVGSIIAVKLTSNSQIKEQQMAANREMKRKYYNAFIEAFTKKRLYIDKPDCIEKIEAEMAFIFEANRLSLYASEEMIQFVEEMKNPTTAKKTTMDNFLTIVRKDLCDNSFEKFSNISGISFVKANKVICTYLDGEKHIV